MQRGRPVVKPRDLHGTLRRLWALTRGHRTGLGWILALSGLASASAILSPLVIGRAVTALDGGHPVGALLALLLGVYLCDWLARFLQQFLMAGLGQRVIHFLRTVLFSAMENLPLASFDRRRHGELMSRLTNDVDNISTTISNSLTQMLTYFFTITGIFIIMMPKKDGLAVLRALRAQGDVTPVLMLTAKAEVEDRVAGLEQGANDYLTKPFSGKELAARIHAMLRTREELAPQKIYLSNVCANREELALEGPGGSVRLSVREFLLLELLTRSPGKPLTRAEAVEKLWSGEGDEAAAEINADYLRHKLRAVGAGVRLTETEDGVWRLESAPPDGSCGQKAFASPA